MRCHQVLSSNHFPVCDLGWDVSLCESLFLNSPVEIIIYLIEFL